MIKKDFEFSFSKDEIKQIFISTLALAFAFSIVLNRDAIFGARTYSLMFLLDSIIVVGSAFVLHEMGHKYVAQKKGCWAEFRAWPAGLLLAIVTAFLGFLFAAPGAVMISPARRTKSGVSITLLSDEDIGKIGAAGPIINIILAGIFGLSAIFLQIPLLIMGAQINAWLAIFNLLPFAMLDGAKIFRWKPLIWGGMLALSIGAFALIGFI